MDLQAQNCSETSAALQALTGVVCVSSFAFSGSAVLKGSACLFSVRMHTLPVYRVHDALALTDAFANSGVATPNHAPAPQPTLAPAAV